MTGTNNGSAIINLSDAAKFLSRAQVDEMLDREAVFNDQAKALLRKRGFMQPKFLSRRQREEILLMVKTYFKIYPAQKAINAIWLNLSAVFSRRVPDEAYYLAGIVRP